MAITSTSLIDKNESFVFGFSKLDVMFGRAAPDAVRLGYRNIVKPGVVFRQATITAIAPETRRVSTDHGTYEADVLVIALGADYDLGAPPGLIEGGHEFYSFAGAERLREVLPTFSSGHAIVGVTSAPFKCPPAPSEAALLLHDQLTTRGVRDACEISLVMPFGAPIPPSPAASRALIAAFAERGITFVPNRSVRALDPERRVAMLDDGSEMPYAVGDVTSVGTAKAGTFSEGAARVVAASVLAEMQGGEPPSAYAGAGSCYVEFGEGRVGRVDVDFLSGPAPTGSFIEPSVALVGEKQRFGSSRRARWFGLQRDLPMTTPD